MTIAEFNKRLSSFEGDVIKKLPDQFIKGKAGFDISATVSERVIQTSVSGDGNKFSPYSTKPMLTSGTTVKSSSVWNARASTKNKRSNLKWVTLKRGGKNIKLFELEGGYAELRRLEGFSNRNKNFWFTTEMWRMFGLKSANKSNKGFRLIFGGKTNDSQMKIDENSAREGKSIIDMTTGEVQAISNRTSKWIDGMLKNNKI